MLVRFWEVDVTNGNRQSGVEDAQLEVLPRVGEHVRGRTSAPTSILVEVIAIEHNVCGTLAPPNNPTAHSASIKVKRI